MHKSVNRALQMRRALQLFAQLAELGDGQRMELADIYPVWREKAGYKPGDIVSFGQNENGETQLWRVISAHESLPGWTPDAAPALFKKIGFSGEGVPLWTQPLGAHDAYGEGDVVEHCGALWRSAVNGNVWEPGVHGWEAAEKA